MMMQWLPPLLLALIILTYFWAVKRQDQQYTKWNPAYSSGFLMSMILMVICLLPGVMEWAHHDLRGHMLQHLLIGMFAPIGIVYSAALTLAYRVLPVSSGRKLSAVLKSRFIQILAQPSVALILNIGSMALLYLTPLFEISMRHPLLHYLMLLHFFAAGYLFTAAIISPESFPGQAGRRQRLFILFLSMGAHAYLSKLMYAHHFPRGTMHSLEQIQQAAQWMYYGGDMSEILLACLFFYEWYKSKRPLTHALRG